MAGEKKCLYCGKGFTPSDHRQMFCSRQCGQRNRWDLSDAYATIYTCPYNDAIGCTIKNCSKCGWNPVVAKARLEAYEGKSKEDQP